MPTWRPIRPAQQHLRFHASHRQHGRIHFAPLNKVEPALTVHGQRASSRSVRILRASAGLKSVISRRARQGRQRHSSGQRSGSVTGVSVRSRTSTLPRSAGKISKPTSSCQSQRRSQPHSAVSIIRPTATRCRGRSREGMTASGLFLGSRRAFFSSPDATGPGSGCRRRDSKVPKRNSLLFWRAPVG